MPSQRPLKLLILVVLLSACSMQQPTQTDLNPQANYWQQLGTTLEVNLTSATTDPSLALDSSGNPVVGLWHEGGPSGGFLYVKRWNGTSWVLLGGSLIVSVQSGPPSMAVDSSNNPVVGWAEGFNVYVKRWNGSSWVGIGNIPTAIPYNPNLALDSSGSPVVSWEEGNGTSKSIYVYRYNPSFTN